MAQTSGYVTTNSYSGRSLRLTWERTSYSIPNNTSTIKWELRGHGSASGFQYSTKFLVKINGDVEYKSSSTKELWDNTLVAQGTKTIHHNINGDASIRIYIEGAIYSSSVNCKSSTSPIYTRDLPNIPRTSKVSASSGYIESPITISIDRNSSKFVHTLKYKINGGKEIAIQNASKITGTKFQWKLPESLYNSLSATAKSIPITIVCYTYSSSGSTSPVGSSTCSITAKTNSQKCAPSITSAVVKSKPGSNTRELTGDDTTLIANYSYAVATLSATAHHGATMKSRQLQKGKTYNFTKNGGTVETGAVTNGAFKFTVIDSRGYITTDTVHVKVVPYINLTCSYNVNINPDGSGRLYISGMFYDDKFGDNPNAVRNILEVGYRYYLVDGTPGNFVTPNAVKISNNKYKVTETFPAGTFDYKENYVFEVNAFDSIRVRKPDKRIFSGYPIFDWGRRDFHFGVPVKMDTPLGLGSGGTGANNAIDAVSNLGLNLRELTTNNNYPADGKMKNRTAHFYRIPSLNMIVFSGYGENSGKIARGDTLGLYNMGGEYRPKDRFPLTVYSNKTAMASIDSAGSIKIKVNDTADGSVAWGFWVTGWWFY